ncbi:hypothetical protein SASPL_104259 [Salvia splendens]|uniref:Receptor-like serine/threonine-protein kinase n=1 Tax=Salvia splendens TaxID=180675 RepID=A0A8X8YGV3_SALSN|nr:hypothetical protein SASPL_104259 [Salvia splendens]
MELSSLNIFMLFFILFSATSTAQDIPPGSTLYASNPQQSWASPNKSFTLSFIQESENAYFAAITYNSVPIWKAGGDPDGAVNSSAELRFLQDGNLQLVVVVGPTTSLVWQSNTSRQGINSASLDNSGNFMLKNGNVSVWTTFDNPTDTIVPEQNFTAGNVLRCGFYSFRLLSSGEMSLRWNNSVEYYTYRGINVTSDLNVSSPSLAMQPEGILSLLDPLLSSNVFMARGSDYGDLGDGILKFVKLDCDGNMRMYSSALSDGVGNRVVRWTAVSDQCEVFGFCGSYGVCKYDEADQVPTCGCPSRNFYPVDPNDGRKGCRMIGDIKSCQTTLLALNNTLFLTYPPQLDSDYFTGNIRACRSNCLVDTRCVASSSMADGTGACYMKRSDFISGHHSPILTSTSYVKVCDPALPNPPGSSRNDDGGSARLKIGVIVLGSGLLIVILVGMFLWIKCRGKQSYESLVSEYSFSDYASGVPVQFSYKKLQQLTKGFVEKLGEGGFGSVYRGVLSSKVVVAVKQLEGIGQGEKQFRMEVATISSTHHLNLVRLVGFCSEGKHRLLVYEFMKNGSLDSFLFPSLSSGEKVSPETSNRRFSLWAYEQFEKGNVGAVVDKRLVESEIDFVQATRVLQVSFWCIQEHPSFRPTMGKVVQMLEGIADVQKPPPPLFLSDGSAQSSVVISSVSSSQIVAGSSSVSS